MITLKTLLIIIAVICTVLLLLYGIGYLFVMILIKRGQWAKPKPGEAPALLEPTGKALLAHNIPTFAPFRALPFEECEIVSGDGLKLRADYLRGAPDTDVTVIFCHGYKSDTAADFASMYGFYHGLGYNLMYVHMRAHGKSEGKYIGFGALDRFDVQLWARKATELFPDTSIFLHGMSMGAATIMQCADLDMPDAVCGLISDCGFSNVNEVFRNLIGGMYHLPATPFVDIFEIVNRKVAGYGFNDADSVRSLRNSRLPLVYICGDCDRFVPLDMAMRIYDACTQEKELLISEGSGHAASFMRDNEKYTQLVTGFINRHKRKA